MSTLVVQNLSLGVGGLPNGSVTTDDIADSAITTAKIADAAVTAAKLDGAQSGSAPIYGARAWVNFNGTGTAAIRASGNVSSITDNGTGAYTVNFTTAMPDTNYSVVATGTRPPGGSGGTVGVLASAYTSAPTTMTTTAVRLSCGGGTDVDMFTVCASIFR